MTTLATTKDQLLAEKRKILDGFQAGKHRDNIAELLEINNKQIKELDKIELLKNINSKYSRLRAMALQAYECEQPEEDITTNDGSFHKTKVKKYPKIAALQYASANWENGRMPYIRINGEKFILFSSKYEYGKDTTFTRPATFSEFLALNSIPENEITIEQYNEISATLNALNEKLKADIAEYEKGLKTLKIHSLSYWGLVSQHNVNLYEYLPTVR